MGLSGASTPFFRYFLMSDNLTTFSASLSLLGFVVVLVFGIAPVFLWVVVGGLGFSGLVGFLFGVGLGLRGFWGGGVFLRLVPINC